MIQARMMMSHDDIIVLGTSMVTMKALHPASEWPTMPYDNRKFTGYAKGIAGEDPGGSSDGGPLTQRCCPERTAVLGVVQQSGFENLWVGYHHHLQGTLVCRVEFPQHLLPAGLLRFLLWHLRNCQTQTRHHFIFRNGTYDIFLNIQ